MKLNRTLYLRICTALALVFIASLGQAAPIRYTLDESASQVGFIYTLNGADQKGMMPVMRADLMIDPQNLRASTVDVLVNVQQTRTGLIFATDALKAPSVLDATLYPTIRFVATEIRLGANGRLSEGAQIVGNITLRGVTRPTTFQASVYRIQGSAPDDLSTLTVRLTGSLRRSDFGADGYSDLVGDIVDLDIFARIQAER